jgi:hypothetical protein
LDIGLADKNSFKMFTERLNFHSNRILGFLIVCNNENEWRRRHEERLINPTPNQGFVSFEHVVQHYMSYDLTPFEHENIIDTANKTEYCFYDILKIVNE